MAVHRLTSLNWPTVRDLASQGLVALLPLGAVEAHGPHLPLGTDILIAEAMAEAGAHRLSASGFEVLMLPTLPIAPAPFAAGFAGTIDVEPQATLLLIHGIARSLAPLNVKALVLVNAHHDPTHVAALRQAVSEDASGVLVFPDLTRRRWAATLTEEFRSGACHAGRYESSIVMAVAPALVDERRMSALSANRRSLVDAIARGQSTFGEAGGPEAYFGDPARASAAEGHEIINRLGAIVETAVLEALARGSCQSN